MKKNSRNLLKEVEDFFEDSPNVNQKSWGVIHQFFHLVLTYMEDNNIKKSDLAKRLGKSRSAISQILNQTPNITVKKMVEIADAIGITIQVVSPQVKDAFFKSNHEIEYSFINNIWTDFTSEQHNVKNILGAKPKISSNDISIDYKESPEYSKVQIN